MPNDPLESVPVERLFLGITKPKQSFRDLVEQLRTVRSLDEGQYRQLKKQLPYFVCGNFHPKVRRKENFASIEYFMFDLDHLAGAKLDGKVLKDRFRQEAEEVLLCFTSPSEDGLKLMFRLAEPCRDAALFSGFYKVFARRFAEKWGLMEVMDFKTSDVTRACFLSVDEDAFFNPQAVPVEMGQFVEELDFGKAERDIKEAEKAIREQASRPSERHDLADDVLAKIKLKLNPDYRQPKKKEHYVPPEVDDVMGELAAKLAAFDMEVAQSNPISFGRQVRVKAGNLWAEVNVFYGKKGFTVVLTPKSGSNLELGEMAAAVMREVLLGQG